MVDAARPRARSDWYPDPTGRHQFRYWDGSGWTAHVADGGVASSDPLDAAHAQQNQGDHPTNRRDDVARRLAQVEEELDSLRERMRKDVAATSDAPGGNILLASVLEKLGESPPAELADTPTLGRLEALEEERAALRAQLDGMDRSAGGEAEPPSTVTG
ncbi:MAG TPA: DUF2510 domain-containing protein [Phycicoccus sp.]|nr:DUF2510 domain-containing protein [Phycicoccus sp.]